MLDIHSILAGTPTVAALLLVGSTIWRFGVHIDRMRSVAAGRESRLAASNVHDRYSFARLGK